MRFRTLLVSVAALGLLASCGDAAVTSGSSAATTTAAGTAAVDTSTVDTSTADSSSAGSSTPVSVPDSVPKPDVKLPAATPATLGVTDVTEGTGAGAVVGDTLVVYYVGVRSADGTEFDNNYDTGTPFPVQIGSGQVIKGWDQGLVGIKQGGRRQLDIPADLAYGDAPPSTDVIKKGDALSFVIDVVAIIPKSDPADAPNVSIPATPNQAELTFTDLIVGDGPGINSGQTVAIQLVAYSAKDGAQLDSSWDGGRPLTFVPGAGQTLVGLDKAVQGMKVGGRRQVDIPFADAFGPDGNTNLGLPASTDLIMVLDLVAVY